MSFRDRCRTTGWFPSWFSCPPPPLISLYRPVISTWQHTAPPRSEPSPLPLPSFFSLLFRAAALSPLYTAHELLTVHLETPISCSGEIVVGPSARPRKARPGARTHRVLPALRRQGGHLVRSPTWLTAQLEPPSPSWQARSKTATAPPAERRGLGGQTGRSDMGPRNYPGARGVAAAGWFRMKTVPRV